MANQISIIIQAQDNASKKIRQLGNEVDGAGKKSEAAGGRIFRLNEHIGALATVAAAAGVATYGLLSFMGKGVESANKLDSALMGLTSVANSFGAGADKAKQAAQELASDGLMTVTDSATGLKNLLASGFSLDQAITLMKRFKDSAAFGRQASLSFGQAISSATEGIKNGNSILVDNAGVTKNLSVMLKEAGLSANDLMNASTDASVRQAIFNGILKETNAQAGNAAQLADSAAGKQAQWSAQTEVLYQRIGGALQPALLELLRVATPIVEVVSGWVAQNPQLAAGILIATTAVTGLLAVAASLGLAISGLGPVFALFKTVSVASIGGVKTAFTTLSALVKTPLVMPAIGVAAALGAIGLVLDAAIKARNAVEQATKAKEDANNEDLRMMNIVKGQYERGEITKAQYQERLRIIDKDYFAAGTNSAPGGVARVGEHGPEDVVLPQGASVTPAYRTRQGGAGGGPTVHIETLNNFYPNDQGRLIRDIGFALELAS